VAHGRGTWQPDGSHLWQAGLHSLLWKAGNIILLIAALLVGGTANWAQQGICSELA
jgi:hypothetical protein